MANYRRVVANFTRHIAKRSSSNDTHVCANAPTFRPVPQSSRWGGLQLAYELTKCGGANQFHRYIDSKHSQLGAIFRADIDGTFAVYVSSPEYYKLVFQNESRCPKHYYPYPWSFYNQLKQCRRGLFFMDDDEWLYHRRILSQLMLKTKRYPFATFEMVARQTVDKWIGLSEKNRGVVPHFEYFVFHWTVHSLLAGVLGKNYNDESRDALEPIVVELLKVLKNVFISTLAFMQVPQNLAYKLNMKRWRVFEQTMDAALSISEQLTTMARKFVKQPSGLYYEMLENNITEQQCIKIIVDLILAAGDTGGNTVEWMLILLARNAAYQTKIREAGGERTALMKRIIIETLRLYPVAVFLNRILPHDVAFDNYLIPKQSKVVMSLYTSGRNREYFKEPLKFWPERWTTVEGSSGKYLAATPFASIPFALGWRSCIGRYWTETHVHMLITQLLDRCEVDVVNKAEIRSQVQMVLTPSQQLQLKLTKRS